MIPHQSKPIIDGFSYSLSRIPSPTNYFQTCVAQLEALRRANGYHMRVYNVPDKLDVTIPAYGTFEYQVRTQPGAYLYALLFQCNPIIYAESVLETAGDILIQITDACTESHLFSDFTLGTAFAECVTANNQFVGFNRPPVLMPQPVLIGPPGLVNVELSNRATLQGSGEETSARTCQLLLFFAEPALPMEETVEILRKSGYSL